MYRIEFKKGNDRMGSGGSMNWTMVIVVARADVFDDCLTSIIIRPCSKNRLASALQRKTKVEQGNSRLQSIGIEQSMHIDHCIRSTLDVRPRPKYTLFDHKEVELRQQRCRAAIWYHIKSRLCHPPSQGQASGSPCINTQAVGPDSRNDISSVVHFLPFNYIILANDCCCSTQNPHVVNKAPNELLISTLSMPLQVVELLSYQLCADLNLKFVLPRLLISMIADLSKVNLVGSVSIAHSILHSIVTAVTDRNEMVHSPFPRTLD